MSEVLPLPNLGPSLTIRVPGKPESWGVVTTVRGKHPVVVLNKKSDEYQTRIATAAHTTARGHKISTPVRIDYTFVFRRLKRHKDPGRHLHIVSPDYDRLLRNVNDGLQRDRRCKQRPRSTPADQWGGFLADDSLIVAGSFAKFYADETEQPHTLIIIRPAR